jgi:PPOX class probable F420-dependent enzyme
MTEQLSSHKYLNLRTYRKTGAPVDTPVWFAEKDGGLYIYSLANAGKIKRIRNNPAVKVAPCDMRGKLRGDWIPGRAEIVDEAQAAIGHRVLNEKYGWIKRIGDFFSRLRKRRRSVIRITL